MTQNTSPHSQKSTTAHESEAEKAKREAGVSDKSSHDHMSRERADTHEGAGGGAKQKQQH